jgi:Xylanase inhibitor N-terminal/Eukaryotic aspartyl protease
MYYQTISNNMRVQGSSSSERHRQSSIAVTPHEKRCMKFAATTTNNTTLSNMNGDHDAIDRIPSKRRKRQLINSNSCGSLDRRDIISSEPQEMMDENLKYCDHIEPPYFHRHRRLQQVNDFNSYKNIDNDKSNNGDMKSNSLYNDKTTTTTTTISQLKEKQAPPEIDVPIEKIQIVPLYHGYGTYYIDLWCGTPIPQHQTMIVDTGSSTTAMTCLPDCTPSRCGLIQQYHPVYVPHHSSTYQKVTNCKDCTVGNCVKVVKIANTHEIDNKNINDTTIAEYECIWNAAYQEGSNWTAFEAMDQCYIGGALHNAPIRLLQSSTSLRGRNKMNNIGDVRNYHNATSSINTNIGINPNLAATHHQFRLQFGCQTSLYGNFRTQDTSGIMGLNVGTTAVWNQMYQQQIISKRAFSICIQSPPTPLHHSSTSGIMTLGGTHTAIHHHTMVYAQQHHNAGESGIGLYMIKLQNIYLSPVTSNFQASSNRIDPSMLQKISIPYTQDFVRTVIIDSGTTDTYFAEQ